MGYIQSPENVHGFDLKSFTGWIEDNIEKLGKEYIREMESFLGDQSQHSRREALDTKVRQDTLYSVLGYLRHAAESEDAHSS